MAAAPRGNRPRPDWYADLLLAAVGFVGAYALAVVHVVDLARDRRQEALRLRDVARYARDRSLHGLGRLVQAVGTWWFLVLVALVVVVGLAAAGRRSRVRAIVAVIAAVLVVVSLGKLGIRNPAVSHALGRPIGSFPSGHTADVTTIVGVLLVALVPIRFRLVPYAVAVVVGLLVASSRVITGAHTPDDVLAGLLLGCALVLSAGAYLAASDARGLERDAEQRVDQARDESRR